jgi:hypothetical protein
MRRGFTLSLDRNRCSSEIVVACRRDHKSSMCFHCILSLCYDVKRDRRQLATSAVLEIEDLPPPEPRQDRSSALLNAASHHRRPRKRLRPGEPTVSHTEKSGSPVLGAEMALCPSSSTSSVTTSPASWLTYGMVVNIQMHERTDLVVMPKF